MNPTAAVVRGDYGPGVVYLGYQPDQVLSGGVMEIGKLEQEVERQRQKIFRGISRILLGLRLGV